ncbi:hypothetical protein LTS15_007060 [Exophiala xenobiotica]|nr:hypothetical protein LTS15_007060 [Exophiala xenobiotica]
MAIIEGGTDEYSKLQEKLKTVKPDAEFRLECVRGILEHCMTQKRGDLKFSKPEKLPASANENKMEPDADEAREASSARRLRGLSIKASLPRLILVLRHLERRKRHQDFEP